MSKPTVVRGEHEHAVRLQGNDPVAQSKGTRSKGKAMEAPADQADSTAVLATPTPRPSVVLPKPRPTPKVANAKPVSRAASRVEAKAEVLAPVMDAGTILSPEHVWETDSQILQRLSALKSKNQQLSAQIQRLTAIPDTLIGKGSES